MLWETGDVSGGGNGYGGWACRVGISNGSDRTLEIAHSGESLAFLDSILSTGQPNYATGLIYNTRNSTIPGRFIFQVRGGQVLGALQVSAGPDQTIPATQTTATLAETAQNPAGGSVAVAWKVVSGPEGATFSNPNSLTPTVTLPFLGTYIVQLTATSATDPQVSAADTMTIFRF